MKNTLTLLAVLLITIPALSQERSKFLYGDFGDLSVTLTPFYKPFGGNFDPALTVGAGINYKQKGSLTFFQTFQLTGYSARIIGDGLNLTTSIGYRFHHASGILGEFSLGAGASLFYSGWQTFSLDEDGTYKEVVPLHVIATVPADLLIGYGTGRIAVYLKYRYMVQAPYASAMPVLPTSVTGIGVRYNLISESK